MVATSSTMLALGTPAPAFELRDVISDEPVALQNYEGKKGLLVMFICAHCPFVIKINEQLASLANDYITKDTVKETARILDDAAYREEMCEYNYNLALRHFSYKVLRSQFRVLLANAFGVNGE